MDFWSIKKADVGLVGKIESFGVTSCRFVCILLCVLCEVHGIVHFSSSNNAYSNVSSSVLALPLIVRFAPCLNFLQNQSSVKYAVHTIISDLSTKGANDIYRFYFHTIMFGPGDLT